MLPLFVQINRLERVLPFEVKKENVLHFQFYHLSNKKIVQHLGARVI